MGDLESEPLDTWFRTLSPFALLDPWTPEPLAAPNPGPLDPWTLGPPGPGPLDPWPWTHAEWCGRIWLLDGSCDNLRLWTDHVVILAPREGHFSNKLQINISQSK